MILEDQVLLADLLARDISSLPGVSIEGIAHNVAEGIELVARTLPDLLILDLVMPDGNGIDVAELLIRQKNRARVIILSGQCHQLVCSRHLHDSIVAVIDKTEALDKLHAMIRELLITGPSAGGSQSPEAPPFGAPSQAAPSRLLTPRELEVFRLLGKGMTTESIARKLKISLLTARTHRRNITAKLGVRGSALILLASSSGQSSR